MQKLETSPAWLWARTKTYTIGFFLIATLCACGEAPVEEKAFVDGQRLVLPLNQAWQFTLVSPDQESKDTIDETKWKNVSLPHTWNAKDGQDGGDNYHRGVGAYQRTFTLDERFLGKQLFLHFDGAAIVTTAYVNGKPAGNHRGSYAAFRFDITDLVKPGENLLEVHVSNAIDKDIAPLSADFTFFGGLYRRVRLIATEDLHLDTMNYASSGVFWSQVDISHESAELQLQTRVLNESDQTREVEVLAQLENAKGEVVSSSGHTMSMAPDSEQAITLDLQFDHPTLWHGRNNPYLYRGVVSIKSDGETVDTVVEQLGLRYFHVDPNLGFFLNGESYPLRGINRMPDMLDKGTAVSKEDHERDLQLMMEIGATSIRLGHQQRDDWVYRRADELGLLVWAEIPLINRIEDSQEFSENLKQQALELVRQNYNRGSIAIWGLYNEVTLKPGPDPRPLVIELQNLVKAEDPHRLTSAAVAAEGGLDDPLVTAPDLISFNRYDGWYYGNFESFPEFLDEMRHETKDLYIGIGEYGAGASPTFQTDKPVIQDHSEPYQALYHEAYWQALRDRPWIWGHYIWVLADFAVDNRNEGDSTGRNDKGLVTFDRKIKKDSFHFYKAAWSDEPVVHVTGRRHTPRFQSKVDIKVYANTEQVELFVNGVSMGIKEKGELPQIAWRDVPLRMGENSITASTRINGETISDEITLSRVNSNDTTIHSQLLGIDSSAGKIYNAPFNVSLNKLVNLIELPDESEASILSSADDTVLRNGDQVRITAQDGKTTRDYTLQDAPISVGKPVWASSEISGEMSIGPFNMPEMSATRANDGVINSDPEQGILEANIWMTMGGKNHWWKVDLGSEYYLDSIEITWPQHASLLVQGAMTYSVDVAADFQQTFDVFSETYREVIDQTDNERPNTTLDSIGISGRFVQVRLHKSGIYSDTPMVGKYPTYGAEEITILGGLLFSESLEVDYRNRTIELAAHEHADEVIRHLQTVTGGSIEMIDPEGNPLSGDMQIPEGSQVIARNAGGSLAEAYNLVVTQ